MTAQAHLRRIGWIAVLALCTALYLMLHLKVHAVKSDVIRSERQIVRLEQETVLLETEFESRANLLQLSAWNQVDFGYTAPTASQFIGSRRQLASFGTPRAASAPAEIRVASAAGDSGAMPDFPKLVSPLTGKPLDDALLGGGRAQLSASEASGTTRIALGAMIASGAE